jgi:hypothetical protein
MDHAISNMETGAEPVCHPVPRSLSVFNILIAENTRNGRLHGRSDTSNLQAPSNPGAYSRIGLTPAAMAAVLTGIIGSFVLYYIRVVPPGTALLGLTIIWVSALPGILYLQGIGRGPVPFFPAVGVFYLVFFGLPVFAIPFGYSGVDNILMYHRVVLRAVKPEALALVFCGICLMVVAFYASRAYLFDKLKAFQFPRNMDSSNLNILFAALIVAHLSFRYFPVLHQVPSLGQLLEPAGALAFGGFYLLWARGRTRRLESGLIFFVLLPLEIYSRIRIFFLTDILLLTIFFILVFWREGKTKMLVGFFVFILLVLLLFPASTHLRSHGGNTLEKFSVVGKGFVETIFRGKTLEGEKEIEREKTYLSGRLAPLVRRLSQIWVFQRVYNQSPDPIPYWNGTSYRPLFTSFVPRMFYPDKPEEKSGHKFGARYGLLEATGPQSSANLPWLTEMLANFGPWGVVFGMSLVGLFLAFLDRLFNRSGISDLEFIFGLTFLFPLVYPESNFSVMTGSMLPLFIALFIYFYFGSKALGYLRQIQSRI